MTAFHDRECPICHTYSGTVSKANNGLTEDTISHLDFQCTSTSHGKHFQIVHCQTCSLKYCSPMISEEDLNSIYSSLKDENYDFLERGRVKTASKALKNIHYQNGFSLLDIGCNNGVFLKSAQTAGFTVQGVEPNQKAREFGINQRKLNITASLQDIDFKSFNVITSWDVIEHLYSPLEFVKATREMLQDGGELHLSTMDIDCLATKVLGNKWPWYMPMHIQYFSKTTIRTMLLKAGFKDIRFYPYIHHPTVTYMLGKILIKGQNSNLREFLMKTSYPVIPFFIGDMMHVVATK